MITCILCYDEFYGESGYYNHLVIEHNSIVDNALTIAIATRNQGKDSND